VRLCPRNEPTAWLVSGVESRNILRPEGAIMRRGREILRSKIFVTESCRGHANKMSKVSAGFER